MKAKIGRPKVAKGKQKIVFPIRFERDHIAAFKRAAKKSNQDVKDWVTTTLVAAAKL